MLRRLEDEVIAARPHLVIWQAGGNGALQRMDPELFRLAMESGLARLRETGADVVLMDNQLAPRILAMPDHGRFASAMVRLAEKLHLGLFSRTALMRRWQAQHEARQAAQTQAIEEAMVGPDGLHHTDHGYDCLAEALSRSIVAAVRPPTGVMAGRR
jgi:lysophospholipase L1-like esterase